jgi:putative ABC transport system permease protein
MKTNLRYAWRTLWKSPATTIGAVLALALGIGATTTMFALLNAVMIRPLPYPDSDRLVELWGTVQRQQVERRGASYADFYDWRAQSRSFDGLASWSAAGAILYGAGEPEAVQGEVIDGPYFELLGAAAIAGRLMDAADYGAQAPPVAVIGERLWERRFGRRRDAIGSAVRLDSRVYTVAGVVPVTFRGRSDAAEYFVAAQATLSPNALNGRGNRSFPVLARLKAGVSREAAQAELDGINAQLERAYPDTNDKRAAQVSPLADEVFGPVRPAVSLLFGAVALVLMLACANVASLLLARSEARRREFSLRRAIGADDRRLVQLLLAESAWLVALGCGAGWILAMWAGEGLLALSPVQLPSFATPTLDWRTLVFVSAVGLLTTVLIGLTPMSSFGGSLAQSLREGAVAARGGAGTRTLKLIVVGEVAITVTLLVGAGLLVRSFQALVDFNPGFVPRGVIAMQVQLPLAAQGTAPAPSDQGLGALALVDELRALPAVTAASLSSDIPLGGASAFFYSAEGHVVEDAQTRPRAFSHRVTPGYFATLGLRFVEGRDFSATELGADSTAVIVSQGVALRFWPGQSAVGRRVKPGSADSNTPWLTIVGVVADANLRGIPRNPTADPDFFFPFNDRARFFAVMLRGGGDSAALVGPARALLHRRHPGVAVFGQQPLADRVDQQLSSARFLSWLISVFAMVALTLSIIGIYGLLAYWVRRRTPEIGVRAALGAGRGQLLRLVVGQALGLTAIGVVVGVVLAIGAGRWIESQLFGVQRFDAVSFAATAAIMLAAALFASLAPALRALRVDPLTALRAE